MYEAKTVFEEMLKGKLIMILLLMVLQRKLLHRLP